MATFVPSAHSNPRGRRLAATVTRTASQACKHGNVGECYHCKYEQDMPNEFARQNGLATNLGAIGFPIAAALSYRKNKSIMWAVLTGMVWPTAIIYYAATGEFTKKY